MKPKSVVTCLPSRNLEKALTFYSECFKLDELKIEEEMITIELGNLSLFVMSHESFEQYTNQVGLGAGYPREGTQLLHSCAIDDVATLEHVFSTAEQFGGSVAKSMHLNEWGQNIGYVRDPDGHVWELVLIADT